MKISTKFFLKAFEQNYENQQLNQLHREFFNYVFKSFSNIQELTFQQQQQNRSSLLQITTETEFKGFCQHSCGIYYKCCLWAINSTSCKKLGDFSKKMKKGLFDDHHIVCQYLLNHEKNNNISLLIDQPYNIVRISYPMHYFFHLIKACEYGCKEDYYFLSIVDQQLVKTLNVDKIFENGVNKRNVKAVLQYELLKNYPNILNKLEIVRQYRQEQSVKGGKKAGLQTALTVLNPEIANYLKKEMQWIYPSLNIKINFKPRQFRIIRGLVIALNEATPLDELPKNWRNDQDYLEDQSTYLLDYLLGKSKPRKVDNNINLYYPYTSFKKWECNQAFSNKNRIENIKKVFAYNQQVKPPKLNKNVLSTLDKISQISRVDKQTCTIKTVLMYKTMEWSHEWWFLHEQDYLKLKTKQLIINPKQFDNLTALVKYLMDLIPVVVKNQYANYQYYNTNSEARKIIKKSFSSILNEKQSSIGKPRNNSAYGWYCNKIS